jgi:FAD/FMN-containing dehydrogenase
MTKVQQLFPRASLLTHAGQGSITVKFADPLPPGFSKLLIHELQPLATAHHGRLVVLSNHGSVDLTPQACWSGSPGAFEVMQSVKKQFDPQNILNRGRFVFGK